MLTVYLFILFLVVYAWVITPEKRTQVAVVANDADLVQDIMKIAETSLVKVWADDEPRTVAKTIAPTPTLTIAAEELEEILPIADKHTPVDELSVSGPLQAIAPDYTQMGVYELRNACSAAGIRWRRVRGKKHLTVAEMREALAVQ